LLKVVGKYDGKDIVEATLQCGTQQVHILNYGCVVRRWTVNTIQGLRDIVLGFDQFDDYPRYSPSFGIIAGRVANRTRLGRFTLQGQQHQLSINNGKHHLHGGVNGLGRRVWSLETDSAAQTVCLQYRSADGEEGYPANVVFELLFRLDESGLHCEMFGQPDAPTPINLAQHNYYNLNGRGDIRDHSLQIDAAYYLAVDDELIPNGDRIAVNATSFDFRKRTTIRDADPQRLGHDHNMILSQHRDRSSPAATLISSDGLVRLSVMTDQPGLQLYTARALNVPVAGIDGYRYPPFGGICLEAQQFPDSLNHQEFPSIICTPDNPYCQRLSMLVNTSD